MSPPNIPVKKSLKDISNYIKFGPMFGKAFRIFVEGIVGQKYLGGYHTNISQVLLNEFENLAKTPSCLSFLTCISINDAVAHGPEAHRYNIKGGDIVSIDAGLEVKGIHFDAAVTLQVGGLKDQWILKPQEALRKIIEKQPKDTRSISTIIHNVAIDNNLNQVVSLAGHGIGYELHEAPVIHNAPLPDSNYKLFDGLCFCAEPIYVKETNEKFLDTWTSPIYIDSDKQTIKTVSGSSASHFETTFIVHEDTIIDVVGISTWEF